MKNKLKQKLIDYKKKQFDKARGGLENSVELFEAKITEGIVEELCEVINQLDEPEVLSLDWIDDNKKDSGVHSIGYYVPIGRLHDLLVPKQEITFEQAYDKIAETFPATANEIKSVLDKYYSSMLIEFSEELHESIMRAFDVEATSKTIEALTGMTLEQIAEEARNGGIVPKQELPVIPKFVAEFLIGKEDYMLYELFDDEWLYKEHDRVAKWLYDNDELTNKQREIDLVMARNRGWVVEEEQKYYVSERDEEYGGFWFLSKNNNGDISIGVNRDWSEVDWDRLKLTEQEIKDYDERYWAFRKPVEELEE